MRNRVMLIAGLCIISLLTGTGFTVIPGLNILFTLVSLISVILAGIWFGKNGFGVAVLLSSIFLVTVYSISGSVSSLALAAAGLLLVAGCISAVLSERMRTQKSKEIQLAVGSTGAPVPGTGDFCEALGLARYCILPYPDVRRLKENKDVRGLIRALTSDDIAIQYDATEALGEIGDPSAVTALIHVLTADRYSAVRWKAAEALAKIGEPAVDPLIHQLGNPSDDVRWKAAIALGDIGDPRAVGPLIRLLSDPDPYVCGRAAFALSGIGQPAVPALIQVVDQGTSGAKPVAVAALGRINDPLAIAPLIRALGDEDEHVRSEALVALERAETNVLETFLVILGQAGTGGPGTLFTGDQTGSGKMNWDFTGKTLRTEGDLRDHLVKALESTGDPVYKPLIRDILSGFEGK